MAENTNTACTEEILHIDASIEALSDVLDFIEARLEQMDYPPGTIAQTLIASEEIFVNIAHYAYKGEKGCAEITFRKTDDDTAEITFADSGYEFNPLCHDEPDITLSADERVEGGLGILLVKKTMDDVRYDYADGKNMLTITKKRNKAV